MASSEPFAIISGVISQDIQSKGIYIPLDENTTLVCKNYIISRTNIIVHTQCVSKDGYTALKSVGALTFKAKGDVPITNSGELTAIFSELSSRKTSFEITVGNQTFSRMILKEFSAQIDRYGERASCSVEFVQLSGDENE